VNKKDFFRFVEWWHVKVSLFFGLLSFFALHEQLNFSVYLSHVGKSFLMLLPVAAWANLANDYGDIESDALAGKPNRLSTWPKGLAFLVTFASIPLLLVLPWWWLGNGIAFYLVLGIILSFFCYSITPFRFKNRGWLGVLMDASGTQLLPGLFALYLIAPSPSSWIVLFTAIWLFSSGCRLHLVHQYQDRANDLRANLTTVLTAHNSLQVQKGVQYILAPLELGSLIVLFFITHQYFFLLVVLLFFLHQFIVRQKLGIKTVLFSVEERERVWLASFYNYGLLFTGLVIASWQLDPWYLLALLTFAILFMRAYTDELKELLHIVRWWRSMGSTNERS
jgi:hypothetical protein